MLVGCSGVGVAGLMVGLAGLTGGARIRSGVGVGEDPVQATTETKVNANTAMKSLRLSFSVFTLKRHSIQYS